jgi:putative transposase
MKAKLVMDKIYHVCNKSIAGFGIFKNKYNCNRFLYALDYYNNVHVWTSLSQVIKRKTYQYNNIIFKKTDSLIKIIAYCIMPDHYHLIFKITSSNSVTKYINDVENSYSRYFNIRYSRKGPLWQSSFRCIRIRSENQLLHTTRYIHLNPVTAGIVSLPEDWKYSSYKDYISCPEILARMTEMSVTNGLAYQKFVEDNIDYQQRLKQIKHLLLE